MKTLSPLFLFIIFIVLIQSCTVEKRLYNKGFHVEWKKRFKGFSSNIPNKSEVKIEESEEGIALEKTISNVPEQDSISTKGSYEVKGLEEKNQSIKVNKEHAFSFSRQSKAEKVSLKSHRLPEANRGGFLRSVFVVLLIVVILPIFFLVIFIAGEYLELILLWLFIVLVAALIIFFIVRMVLTAVRY